MKPLESQPRLSLRLWRWVVLMLLICASLLCAWLYLRQLALAYLDALQLGSTGSGLHIYANGNDGAFPPTLEHLLAAGLTTRDELVSANAPARTAGCHYYYVCELRADDPPYWVAAYSDISNTLLDRVVVLRVCGTVDSIALAEFRRQWAKFASDFRASRGRPPTVIPPRYEPKEAANAAP